MGCQFLILLRVAEEGDHEVVEEARAVRGPRHDAPKSSLGDLHEPRLLHRRSAVPSSVKNGGGLGAAILTVFLATLAHAAPREANGYTRYELLAPGSAKFRIVYDITAVTPGSTEFFNPIRKGSIATDERVTDLASGAPLKFEAVSGEAAKAAGWSDADASMDYIEVHLARPVPADGGEERIQIEKTYADPKSYRIEGDQIVFDRSLGIKKNAVVLPAGYGLV